MRTVHGQPSQGLPVCSHILLPASGLVTSHKTGLEFWDRRLGKAALRDLAWDRRVLAEYSHPFGAVTRAVIMLRQCSLHAPMTATQPASPLSTL